MLSAPGDLDEGALAAALDRGWGIRVADMTYRAVGWGSHHWEVAGADRARWFVTVDELDQKRVTAAEPADEGFGRLTASLSSAVALRDAGLDFVLAPLPLAGGRPAARFGGRFAVAVYPFVAGESFSWGEWAPGQRARMAEMLAAVHMAHPAARRYALAEEFAIPFRDELEAGCAGRDISDCGPYALPLARQLAEHAAAIRRMLRRYDRNRGRRQNLETTELDDPAPRAMKAALTVYQLCCLCAPFASFISTKLLGSCPVS